MPRFIPCVVALLLVTVAVAPPPTSVEQIPVLDRPQDHFYGAIAGPKRVEVWWEVTPAEVPLGESFSLSLVVANAVNPHELSRPPLLELSGFRELFSAVEPLPADAPTTSGEIAFRYRVTPRNVGTFCVPELTYRYYQPLAPEGRRTFTTRAEAIPFVVAKQAEVAVRPVPLVAPEELFDLRTDDGFSRHGGPGVWAWIGLFAGTVGVVVLWVVGWRVLFPDTARLAVLRRNRAVRTALDQLRKPRLSPAEVTITVRNYLIARHGLSFTAQTPAEVASGLTESGLPPERVKEAEELLRQCDAARFAGADNGALSPDRARAMIERWEGVR